MNESTGRSTSHAYYLAFAALSALTALTVAIAFVDLGGLNTTAAVAIAAAKAMLVAMCFMHLRRGPPLVIATVAAGGFWLAILMGFALSDFLTRHW